MYYKLIFSLSLVGLLFVQGCGFKPLYAEDGNEVEKELSDIKINRIVDREGQLFRNSLLPLLTPSGAPKKPKYSLTVDLTISPLELAYLKDDTASRMQILLTTSYTLFELSSGKVLTKSSFPVYVDYNIVTASDFSTVLAKQTSIKRAIHMATQQLRLMLSNYFVQRRNPVNEKTSDQTTTHTSSS